MEISRRSLLKAAAGIAVGADVVARQHERSHATLGERLPWVNADVDAALRVPPRAGSSASWGHEDAQATGVNISTSGTIEGYADAMSVNTGEPIRLRVSSAAGDYRIAVLRMGWYAGAGALEVFRSAVLTGTNHSRPAWDGNGLIACNWPAALTVSTAGWSSGYYLASLIPVGKTVGDGYVPFVVRDDNSLNPILMQIPFTTYQAYNTWGGKSLYGGNDGVRANRVSFDRPYQANGGTQYLFAGDYQLAVWLEKNGYPVTYAASSDVHSNPALMFRRSVMLSAYHDEYWSQPMRDNLTSWLASARSVGMLSANNLYWRVRMATNASGVPNRTMICYKDSPVDPDTSAPTVLFSQVNQSEGLLQGVEFAGFGSSNADWIVNNASHWIYSGTGVREGDRIAGLVGTEWDRASTLAPSDTTIVARSPTMGTYGASVQSGAVRDTVGGGVVFSAGTLRFPLLLGGPYSPGADARVDAMTRNFLQRAATLPGPTPTTSTPTTSTSTSISTSSTPTSVPPSTSPTVPGPVSSTLRPAAPVAPGGSGGGRNGAPQAVGQGGGSVR